MQRTIYLTPPLISPDYIKEKIICIRAHRERIFRVENQIMEDKLVCHNYGQGGAGWTFLFGCVHESVRQFEQALERNTTLKNKPICVVGAGCYGLLTAIILARKGHAVRIVAQETQDIPSNKAAGFFFPRPRRVSTPEECAIFKRMGVESYTTYLQIIKGDHPFIKQGPKLLPAYYDPNLDPGFAPYINDRLMIQPERVTIDFGTGKAYTALEYQTVFINSAAIMDELKALRNELEIPLIHGTISSFLELREPIIFNCAALGAKLLADDKRMIPVQGHLITLKNQPDITKLQYMLNVKVVMVNEQKKGRDELIYFAPKESGILGITFIRGQDSTTANQHEFDRLLKRCHDYFGIQ